MLSISMTRVGKLLSTAAATAALSVAILGAAPGTARADVSAANTAVVAESTVHVVAADEANGI